MALSTYTLYSLSYLRLNESTFAVLPHITSAIYANNILFHDYISLLICQGVKVSCHMLKVWHTIVEKWAIWAETKRPLKFCNLPEWPKICSYTALKKTNPVTSM